jgi:hypothetical protein
MVSQNTQNICCVLCCRFDSLLNPVVTLTTELASQQATAAQQALTAANTSAAAANSSSSSGSSSVSNVSLLTGVPYGLKDLMAVPGYPTSWGLTQLRNRTINTVRAEEEKSVEHPGWEVGGGVTTSFI